MNDWTDFFNIMALAAVIVPTTIYLDKRAVELRADNENRRRGASRLASGGTIRRVK